MSASSTVIIPNAGQYSSAFWERLWRTSGIGFIAFFVIGYVIYGFQPQPGAAPAVVLMILGGTTWMSDGVWAPDGVYSRFIAPLIGLVWIVVVTRVLTSHNAASANGW